MTHFRKLFRNTAAVQFDLNNYFIFITGCTVPPDCEGGWSEWGWSHFFLRAMLLLFILLLLWLQRRAGLHMSQNLQRKPHASMPRRLWAVHRLRAAKPGYDSKVCCAQSSLLNPMEAIKPFIFYVLVSWLSYCWGRRDTGPTSQKPQRNYSIWIIHLTWGWYLLKGQTCLYCPLTVK